MTDEKNPVDIDRLFVATFTVSATAEMKERIRKAINDEIKKSEDIIKTNSYKVLLDKNVRRKAKIAIIMFACSKKMMIKVYKHVDRWK